MHTLPDLTVEAYAAAKRLPVEFLRDLGVADYIDSRFKRKVLRIPYRDTTGKEAAVRIRKELHKRADGSDERFIWRQGSRPLLYGLWRARAGDAIVLVEGESDAHVLWHYGPPCIGLPGAATWRDEWARHFDGIERIYVVVEPDRGGEAVLGWLGRSKIRDRAWLVELDGYKDPAELHLADPERFTERWAKALEASEPWRDRAARIETAERRQAAERCADLTRDPRILDRFAEDLRKLGVVGEERLAKLLYLATTSRLLDQIVSVAVKGPSAAGKSFAASKALSFFPSSAFYVLTAMSERGLIFVDADMRHRMLVIFEAQGMEGDLQSYLLRSLLSEGQIRYQTTRKEGGEITGHLVELEGPTGLVVTTTAISLHVENETRLLSVTATDTQDQTQAVMKALAEERDDRPDLTRWHALQRWLELGDHRVTVPFGMTLAEAIPPVAVRLRRDFGAILGLIRASAVLHQASRERDAKGRIVASIEDYRVVRELVADLVAERIERTVSSAVREAVEAVRGLKREHGATRREVAKVLKIDPRAAGRRLASARNSGYLRNLETTRGRPARWVLGEPLPENIEILPTPEDVCTCAADPEGSQTPPPRRRYDGDVANCVATLRAGEPVDHFHPRCIELAQMVVEAG